MASEPKSTGKVALGHAIDSFSRAINKEKMRGRPPRVRRLLEGMTQEKIQQFFEDVIPDQMEKELWQAFITGTVKVTVKADDGTYHEELRPVELSTINLQAFLKAVAYKRGQPKVAIETSDTEGKFQRVEIITIGVNDEHSAFQHSALTDVTKLMQQ